VSAPDRFYAAMLPRLGAVLEHLAGVPMTDSMDRQSAALLNLAKSVAEVAPAVEQFREPAVSNGYDVKRFRTDPE